MLLLVLVLLPAAAGGVAFLLPRAGRQRWLMLAAAAAHFGLVVAALAKRPAPAFNAWLDLDALGLTFLLITSTLFLLAALYAVGYLAREVNALREDWVEGTLFSNAPERLFVGCMLFFLASMTLVTLSQQLGLLWVSVEATTLASAPLIYFHRHHRSLEATWKYLVIASVGIALALLGTLFVAAAAAGHAGGSVLVKDLVEGGAGLQAIWLKAGFVLLLVGYGTKMGLAPLHTWLPDAHSESPSLVSALMSGALLNCAFLAILRAYQVMHAAGQSAFANSLLIAFGLLSMGVAAALMLRQTDYKRLLAYSSVEHMGILAVGVGIGGAASFGALLHAMNHSMAKGLLFLIAGNILAVYKTTATRGVRGVLRVLPVSGALWVAGFLAITGSPPFGSFFSEFAILQATLNGDHPMVAGLYLLSLAVAFIGMVGIFLRMAQGEPWSTPGQPQREAVLAIVPPLLLALAVLLLGIYIPPVLEHTLHAAAGLLGGI